MSSRNWSISQLEEYSHIRYITRFNKFEDAGDKIEFYDIRYFDYEDNCWRFAQRWFETISDANFYRMCGKLATREVDIVKVTWEIAEHVEAYDRSLEHDK